MHQHGKMGSGARPEEVVPEGRRDVEGAGGRDLPILWQRASGKGPTAPELGQRERRVPQIGTCCLNSVERRNDAHPPFLPADGMRLDH